tara:strand:- start:271 stop:618 length:348 start_codon:yes stop_codon:yes gene_type:complete
MSREKSKREKLFAPLFRVIDFGFGALTIGLASAYVLRRYVEYMLTGRWGRTIIIEDPSIRRENHYSRRRFDAESYRTKRYSANTKENPTGSEPTVEVSCESERSATRSNKGRNNQ